MSEDVPPRVALLDAQELPATSTVSMITLAELQRGLYTGRPSVRAARRQRYQAVRTFVDVAPFSEEATYYYGQLCAVQTDSGRSPKARTLDLMIAATAVAEGVPILTCNPGDFAAAEGFVPVHALKQRPSTG